MEANPDDVDSWYQLGLLADKVESFDRAVEAFAKVTELQPDNARAWAALSRAYARKSEVSEGEVAEECVKKATEAFQMYEALQSQNQGIAITFSTNPNLPKPRAISAGFSKKGSAPILECATKRANRHWRRSVKIRQIEIKSLFGYFDHEIPLKENDRITIIHGPNGVGKTTVLRLVHDLFKRRFHSLFNTPFDRIVIHFKPKGTLTVSRIEGEKLQFIYNLGKGTDRAT